MNSYLIKDSLIDPGMASGRSLLDLARGLREAGPGLCGVERLVVTHFHVDHSTASLLVHNASEADLYIGRRDLQVIRDGVERFVGSALELFIESGMPPGEVEEIRRSHPALRLRDVYMEAIDLDWRPLAEGDTIRLGDVEARVIEAPGHTPGHILLQLPEGALMVGDTLLPGITPHVTLHDWGTDPLGDYLASLRRIIELAPSIAYPGHRDPITDPAGRAGEIIEHHRSRLGEVLELLKQRPMTGYEVAQRIRWRTRYTSWQEYPAPERFFAMGEALAHLRRLEVEGLVEPLYRDGARYWRII